MRGTTRNLENASLKGLPGAKERLELVKLDLLGPAEEFEKAVEGADFVLHTASPFPGSKPKDEMDLINPAVQGTTKMLEACAAAGDKVKRVVITSSTAAIQGGGNEAPTKEQALDEKSWTNLEVEKTAYTKSKTMAERAAWKFMEEKKPAFTLATCNPCFVVGYGARERERGRGRGTEGEGEGERGGKSEMSIDSRSKVARQSLEREREQRTRWHSIRDSLQQRQT